MAPGCPWAAVAIASPRRRAITSRHFAEAVAGHGVGLKAEASQDRELGKTDGGNGRLGVGHVGEAQGLALALRIVERMRRKGQFMQRPAGERRQRSRAVPHGARVLEGKGEPGAHAQVLAALAGKQKSDAVGEGRALADAAAGGRGRTGPEGGGGGSEGAAKATALACGERKAPRIGGAERP
jgi:hypothetical protein